MKRGGPLLWLLLVLSAGLSIRPASLLIDEVAGDPVPEVNGLFIIGLALALLMVIWLPAVVCLALPRRFIRISALVLLLIPYGFWVQELATQGFFWSLVRPDMATGEGYFDTKPERDLATAIVACYDRDDRSKCDFPKIDALARAANVNTIGLRDKSFMDLALEAGAPPEVVGSLLRAGETAKDARRQALDYACVQNQPDLARAVLEAGVDPNLRTADGTPLMIYAVEMPDGLAAFLDAGADANAEAPYGWTALMNAVKSMQFKSVGLLLAHGAREDRVAKDGTTLDKLMADVPPYMLENLPPDVDAFVKRHRAP